MSPPKTYRNRLIFYIVLLEVFLIGVLFFFYSQSRDAILESANRNIGLFVSQVKAKIKMEEHELQQSARLISDNIQLREYMFLVVNVGVEIDPLHELFQRKFGWLPYNSAAIFSKTGRILIGGSDKQFLLEIYQNQNTDLLRDQIYYFATENSVEMAAFVPVYYQDQLLGNVVLTRTLDASLIKAARNVGYGQFFVVMNGKLVRSSLEEGLAGREFSSTGSRFKLGRDDYLVREITFSRSQDDLPQIWFGISNAELTGQLEQSRTQIFILALGGSIAILIIGVVMIRNFSRPVSRLVDVMHHVGEGRFPEILVSQSNDEIGYLTSNFQDMITRLKEKQDEVDRVHAQLEEQATTDGLTGFYNRRYLYDLYPKLLSEADRQGKTMTVILADLDLFKEVNDNHGHVIGDKVLAHVSDVIRNCCRVSDFIFRIGGEEFLVLTTGGIKGGEVLAEKIRTRIDQSPVALEGLTLHVTSSFGVAQREPDDGEAALSAVLTRADKALYAAKDAGRNRVSALDVSTLRSNKKRR
jgi:diguanylate cyclase (GGDEF)-like protein